MFPTRGGRDKATNPCPTCGHRITPGLKLGGNLASKAQGRLITLRASTWLKTARMRPPPVRKTSFWRRSRDRVGGQTKQIARPATRGGGHAGDEAATHQGEAACGRCHCESGGCTPDTRFCTALGRALFTDGHGLERTDGVAYRAEPGS